MIEPLLYRTLIFGVDPLDGVPAGDFKTFTHIARAKLASFLRNSVLNVLIRDLDPDSTLNILATCPNIRNIHIDPNGVLWSADDPKPPALHDLPLKHLHCQLYFLFAETIGLFTLPVFAHITHLELLYWPDKAGNSPAAARARYTALGALPRLTHLAVPSHTTTRGAPILTPLIETCKLLRVLVVLHPRTLATAEIKYLAQNDVRFVMMGLSRASDTWQVGTLTGVDYWARAAGGGS
ncbi:hypothetical protein B0H19DRAFT_1140605 [Mycena capillaripes]|nr:hypothetical protein B0H19DRAFT_1140605 [Mycena capillaripes]